jgi:hypothetical protein
MTDRRRTTRRRKRRRKVGKKDKMNFKAGYFPGY